MSFKHLFVVIFIANYICVCKCDDDTDIKSLITSLLEPYENLASLPKNFVLTEEEIYNYTQDYLAGVTNEDVYLNGTQLIQKYGYNYEEYHVITSDGYNLSMYRIPGKGPVVFLMHGLVSSFVDWLTAGPDKGLAYLLAAKGYDVWMGNARGNTYSRKHIQLSPSDSEFWDFSWDEIGRLDLPAMIDQVLETTGQKSITYVGHSQGTTAFFVMCSEKPEYNDKINFMVALSAVAWMEHITNPLMQIAAPYADVLAALGKAMGLNEVAPDNDITKMLTLTLCGNSYLATIICSNVEFLICGFDFSQINYKQVPVIYNHAPSGSSQKQLQHYAQLIVSGYFRKYDYGTISNLVKYGSSTPPSYAVDKITVPIAIFYSQGDMLANPIDVEVLRSNLKNVVDYSQVDLLTFNHGDFLWAKDVKSLVYDRVLKLIADNQP